MGLPSLGSQAMMEVWVSPQVAARAVGASTTAASPAAMAY